MHVGEVIQGKFRVERVLGKGGMGTVVVATHLQLNQRVALKFLHDELASDAGLVERFLREARSAARLHSDYVCRVSDVGQMESGAPYMVMELLDGEDLSAVIARRPLDVPTAVSYVLQACIAIAEAHAAGMVHRDLKPSNLFLTKRVVGKPIVKVLDFGIAKAPASSEFKITRTSMVMGSPGYMSPEQLRSAKDADVRSDVWSLGVILYELVSGRLPFPGESITELTMKVAMDPPVPLMADSAYTQVVMRCLEKPVDRRYQSVADLARDLAACGGPDAHGLAEAIASFTALPAVRDDSFAVAATLPPSVPPIAETLPSYAPVPAPAAAPPVPQTTMQASASEVAAAPKGSRRGPVLAGAVLAVVAAAAVIAVVASRGGSRKDRHVASSPVDAASVDAPARVAAVDAAVTVASIDAAPPDAPAFDTDALSKRCRTLQSSRDWSGLDACAAELAPHDATTAAELAAVAKRELAATPHLAELDKAIRANDLDAARKAVAAIDASSVLRPAADKRLAELRGKERAAKKRSDDAVELASKPAEPPDKGCSAEAIQQHKDNGTSQLAQGNYAAALAEFDAVLKCRPADGALVMKQAYLAACHAHRFERAKSLFRAVGAPANLAQICIREGFDPQ